MRPLPAAIAFALLASLAAGCADNGSPAAQDTVVPDAFGDVQVTDTTGAIRGVVVNEAIVPIAGVLVALQTGANQTTDAQGAFVFNGLEPGTYFLTASKAGYGTVQQSAEVEAGVAEPPITKVQLATDAASQPYVVTQQWSAFLQCGVNVLAVSVNPCFATGSDNVHDFAFDGNRTPDFAQAEAIWEGTQPAGNWLWLQIHDPATTNGNCYMVNSQSPAVLRTNQTAILDCWGDEADHMTYKIFPGNSEDTPPVPTALTNQQYDIYVQYFYRFTPREDYTLAVEGPCASPDQCS